MSSIDQPNQEDNQNRQIYKYTAEELRVLKECNTEAFYQRCLPMGVALGLTAWYGVKQGFLKPNAKWGASPKVMLGITVGYFLGKISYRNVYAERIMQLPNSPLGDMLRRRFRGGMYENNASDKAFGSALSLTPYDQYSDEASQKGSALDLDTNKPHYSGLDDDARPSVDRQNYLEEDLQLPLVPPKSGVSYEELRQQNRDEYAQRQSKKIFNKPAPRDDSTPVYMRTPDKPRGDDTPRSVPKNKYGDAWSN